MRGLLLKMSNYDANGGSASQASPIYLEHRLVITTNYDTNGGSILRRSLIHIGNNIN